MKKNINEYCGLIGIYNNPEAAEMAYLGLYTLQHRGQEGAGIVSSDGEKVYRHLGQGLVNEVFDKPEILKNLRGHLAIGHNRYSTTGANQKSNVQPILVNTKDGALALGHNGNLSNSAFLRKMLQNEGAIFQTTTDSELIVHLIARSRQHEFIDKVKDALRQIQGAFCLLMMRKNELIIARDINGFRPLALGRLGDGYAAASETCAFDLIGADYIRDVRPGELIIINENGIHFDSFSQNGKCAHCIFEFVYFSRPDSRIFGECVDKTRRKLGRTLAIEHPADADMVISVPDSSNTAALGYAQQSGIKFEMALIRNHYIGRTFIQPQQTIRHFNVKVKFNPIVGLLEGKRVVVVEDSIVRGTTLRVLTDLIRKAGAREVHVRVSSPPIANPCYYGMDFPTREELIAHKMTVSEIQKHLNVDSLGYLSMEGLLDAVSPKCDGYCAACFGGKYPVPVEHVSEKTENEI
jgi:amidophosphoribosyltransferase